MILFCSLSGCDDSKNNKTQHGAEKVNLIPETLATAPNYWCTWYWQNYAINGGEPIEELRGVNGYTNEVAREEMTEQALLGPDGWARMMLAESRGEYYFLIDHGWQDKSTVEGEKNSFYSLVMSPEDFPSYADLEPKDRIKKLNEDLQKLGWRGLGLWVRGDITPEKAEKLVKWSKYAGVEYWKIDGGDTDAFNTQKAADEFYPQLSLEYATGAGGPLNSQWRDEEADHYSAFAPEIKNIDFPDNVDRSLEAIKKADIFRTYDAVPLLVSTVTLQRIHDVLKQTAGNDAYTALLNIQDDPNIAAALGMLVAVKRHPMNNPRTFDGRDIHFQIAGDRHVDKRFNEMDRLVRWQRIAPPMPAGVGAYKASNARNYDQIIFRPGDTWMQQTWNEMVTQSAPKIMARNIELPEVRSSGDDPYIMASRFPNGAISVATEGRVRPDSSWYHPRSTVSINIDDGKEPVGVFGHYESLVLNLDTLNGENLSIHAQDLLADRAIDITGEVRIEGKEINIPGKLIDKIGTSENDPGDISAPGLVLKIDFQEP